MSAPIRTEGDDNHDKFLLYAPRWVREGATTVRQGATIHAPPLPPRDIVNAPMAPGVGGPNVVPPPMAPGIGRRKIAAPSVAPAATGSDAPPLPPRFEGDVAIEALRRRLALDPQPVPEPPIQLRRSNRLAWIGRLLAMCAVAALGAFGLTWMTSKPVDVASAPDRELIAPAAPVGTKSARGAPLTPARLVVESQRGDVNKPLALGVSLEGKVSGETLMVAGFAEGTRLSAGAPLGRNGWQLSAMELGRTMAYAPPDFVGAMEARVDLRANDRVLDSQLVRLEWLPKQPEARLTAVAPAAPVPAEAAPQPLAPDEIAGLLKRADEFLRTGDIASARLLLRRAAHAGSAPAALTLGATFDGEVLAQLGVLGFARDVEQARTWYRKAAEMGSREAEERLEALGRAGK